MDAPEQPNESSANNQLLNAPVTPNTAAVVDPNRNKKCDCKTSKFFPHRRSKCALRARNADATAAMVAGIAGTAVAAGSLAYMSSAIMEERRSSKVTTTTTTSTETIVQNTRSSAASSSSVAAERPNSGNESQELATHAPPDRSSSDMDDRTDEESASARTVVVAQADRSPPLEAEAVCISRKETTTSVVSQSSSSSSSSTTTVGASQWGANSSAGRSDAAFDCVWRPAPANSGEDIVASPAAAAASSAGKNTRSALRAPQGRQQMVDPGSVSTPNLELVDQGWGGGQLAPAFQLNARTASASSSVPSRVKVSQLPQSMPRPAHHQPTFNARNPSRHAQEPPTVMPSPYGGHDWSNAGMGNDYTGMLQDLSNPFYESDGDFSSTQSLTSNSESVTTMESAWSSSPFMAPVAPAIPFSSNGSLAPYDALYASDDSIGGGNSFQNYNTPGDPIAANDVVVLEPENFEALNVLKEYVINQINYTVDLAKNAEKVLGDFPGSDVCKLPAVLNFQQRLLNRIERFEDFQVDEDTPLPQQEIQAQIDKFRSASYEDFVVLLKFVDIMHRQLTSGAISYNKEGFAQLQEIHNLAMKISE